MKHIWSVAISILCLIAVATSAALPNRPAETTYSPSAQASGIVPYSWTVGAGALPQNLERIPRSTNTDSGILNRSLLLDDHALDRPETVAPGRTGLQQSCIPPGGRCHHRGTCCPVSGGYHDVCGGNGICIVL